MNGTGNERGSCAVAVPAEPASGKWQSIDTAPLDGTIVLATWRDSWPKSPHLEAVYRYAGTWYYAYDGDCHTRSPTHWMPLPAPPETTP